MKSVVFAICTFLFFSASAQNVTVSDNIYDLKVAGQKGGTIDLAKYKGKKILIVNTPAGAINSPQYAELEAFYKQYKDRVEVIAFLDDDFGPAPGAPKGRPVTKKDYHVSFPVSEKVFVKGNKMTPVYHWLTEKEHNKLEDTEVKWDFQKYLVNEQGQLVAVFDPKVRVTDQKILSAIGQ